MSGDHAYAIRPRRTWTAEPHAADHDEKTSRVLYVHITETRGGDLITSRREQAAIRAIRDYHLSRGWADVGYSYLCAQPHGRPEAKATLYVGRGATRIPAAQQGANRGNWAVAVIANADERIFNRTVDALGWLAAYLGAAAIRGHRDNNATDCPGDRLYSLLPDIRAAAKRHRA